LDKKRSLDVYFGRETSRVNVRQPFSAIEMEGKFDGNTNMRGAYPSSKAGAIRHCIAQALMECDEALGKPLRRARFIIRDARKVERNKCDLYKARNRP